MDVKLLMDGVSSFLMLRHAFAHAYARAHTFLMSSSHLSRSILTIINHEEPEPQSDIA